MSQDAAVKVFISYSHDLPEHERQVLALSERLRADGIDCWIEQFERCIGPHAEFHDSS